MHEFTFDVKIAATITVCDENAQQAESRLNDIVVGIERAVALKTIDAEDSPVSVSLYIDDEGGPLLIAIDGEEE
jgi:hypothetical protein